VRALRPGLRCAPGFFSNFPRRAPLGVASPRDQGAIAGWNRGLVVAAAFSTMRLPAWVPLAEGTGIVGVGKRRGLHPLIPTRAFTKPMLALRHLRCALPVTAQLQGRRRLDTGYARRFALHAAFRSDC